MLWPEATPGYRWRAAPAVTVIWGEAESALNVPPEVDFSLAFHVCAPTAVLGAVAPGPPAAGEP
jgi:hypothetical protein